MTKTGRLNATTSRESLHCLIVMIKLDSEQKNTFGATYKEIAEKMGLERKQLYPALAGLKEAGFIYFDDKKDSPNIKNKKYKINQRKLVDFFHPKSKKIFSQVRKKNSGLITEPPKKTKKLFGEIVYLEDQIIT